MAFDMSRFIARFVEEAHEHLTLLNEGLLAWRQNPGDQQIVFEMFRSAHTIKGAAGMLKLKPIAETALNLEDALNSLREGKIAYSAPLAALLRQGVDALALQVQAAAEGKVAESDAELCQALARAAAGEEFHG